MAMVLDFNGYLCLATLLTGILWGTEVLYKRSQPEAQDHGMFLVKIGDFCRSIFPVLLLVLLLRVVVAEPFRIPSGSMKPSLLEGEFIVVNKMAYGVRAPLTGTKIIPIGGPKRGDIAVFRSPLNPQKINFVKRIVGLPGDTISYQDKMLYINGEPQVLTFEQKDFDTEPNGYAWRVKRYTENLMGKHHKIFLRPGLGFDMDEITIPEGYYFAMGDNRDNSEDSRSWGMVSDEYLIGKAVYVWMSWDSGSKSIRWDRLGSNITKL